MDIPAADVLLPLKSRDVPLILLHPSAWTHSASAVTSAQVSAGEPNPSQKVISAEMVEFHGRINAHGGKKIKNDNVQKDPKYSSFKKY